MLTGVVPLRVKLDNLVMAEMTENYGGVKPTSLRGRLVAQLLSGAWRVSPPAQTISEPELVEIAPLLLRSGAGGLAWCKIRNTGSRGGSVAHQLQQAYRLHSLESALHERGLKQALPILASAGVEPVLVKGWSIARLYPEAGMRPYGDFDLCVLPDQYASAKAALKSTESQGCNVDLHLGFGKFYDNAASEIFARCELARIDDLVVRVLCAEDHLRFLCMHMLRHGAVRPLWLCDIAMLLENRSDDFDWERCLGDPPRQADWVACALGLAHHLLGVELVGTPIESRSKKLPSWLMPAVLEEWGTPFQFPAQISAYFGGPARLLRGLPNELPRHWPNPIEATVSLKGPFNELPRLPFQIGHVFSRTAALLQELTRTAWHRSA